MQQDTSLREALKPNDSIERYRSLVLGDISRFLSYAKFQEVKQCPCCGSLKIDFAFSKNEFLFSKCNECQFIFVNPIPSEDSLRNYYRTSQASQYFQTHIIRPTTEKRIDTIIRPRAIWLKESVEKFIGSEKTVAILDIGCSVGLLLSQAKTFGWKLYGTEYESNAAEVSRKLGVELLDPELNSIHQHCLNFDIITMFEVLEHVGQPLYFLNNIHELIRDGGLLALTVPNIKGLEYKILGLEHGNIAPPAHLNYFCISSLTRLLKRASFKIVSIETPGLLDIQNILQHRRNHPEFEISSNNPFIVSADEFSSLNILNEAIKSSNNGVLSNLQAYLQDTMMSGHLRIIAQKI